MTRRRVRKALACAVVAILVALVAFPAWGAEGDAGILSWRDNYDNRERVFCAYSMTLTEEAEALGLRV